MFTFQSDCSCSLPVPGVNYVSSCNIRGTLDILWSCLFTLFLCTWTAQHLNVPRQQAKQTNGPFRQQIASLAEGIWTKTKWMVTTLILPELLVGRALQEWMMARRSSQNEKMKYFTSCDHTDWTIVHAFFANMGGFVVALKANGPSKTVSEKLPEPLTISTAKRDIGPAATETPEVLDADNGIEVQSATGMQPKETNAHLPSIIKPTVSPSKRLDFHVNARQIYLLRSWGLIESMPQISASEISSKSRSDHLVKATALAQVLWLFIQTIGRGIYSQPISQLEIATLAFSVCAFIAYLFSWHKPQDVQSATFIGSIDELTVWQIHRLTEASGHSLFWHLLGFAPFLNKYSRRREARLLGPVANDITYWDLQISLNIGVRDNIMHAVSYTFLGTGTLLSSMVFGGIHCVAWNFHFPTDIERTLWQVSSVVSAAVLAIHPLVHTVGAYVKMSITLPDGLAILRKGFVIVLGMLTLTIMVAYVVARLFLMFEVFRTLFFLPPGAFVATWSSSVPHVG